MGYVNPLEGIKIPRSFVSLSSTTPPVVDMLRHPPGVVSPELPLYLGFDLAGSLQSRLEHLEIVDMFTLWKINMTWKSSVWKENHLPKLHCLGSSPYFSGGLNKKNRTSLAKNATKGNRTFLKAASLNLFMALFDICLDSGLGVGFKHFV